ncbi:hypothetical protein AAMO2058_001497500 [Amorphochlora amoebiformis]
MDSKREEDAAQLQLGEDFKDARCLWNAEVAIILEATVKKAGNKLKSLAMIEETLNYVNKFKNFKTKPAVTEARKFATEEMKKDIIEEFEMAVINNCGIFTAEEAMELIPTLNDKFSNRQHELQDFLDELASRFS